MTDSPTTTTTSLMKRVRPCLRNSAQVRCAAVAGQQKRGGGEGGGFGQCGMEEGCGFFEKDEGGAHVWNRCGSLAKITVRSRAYRTAIELDRNKITAHSFANNEQQQHATYFLAYTRCICLPRLTIAVCLPLLCGRETKYQRQTSRLQSCRILNHAFCLIHPRVKLSFVRLCILSGPVRHLFCFPTYHR